MAAPFLRNIENQTGPEFENPVKIGTQPVQKRIKKSAIKNWLRESNY